MPLPCPADINAQVLGIDASPHMVPEDPPSNLEIQIDDLNGRFTFPSDHFDVVHSQMMAGGIHANRWGSYVRDIFRVLRPGGWCQMVEIYFNAQWSSQYLDAMQPYKNPRAALQLPNWMRSAGFTEVESRLLTLPMCAWSNEPRDHSIGLANSENVAQLLQSLALYPFTQLKGSDTFLDRQLSGGTSMSMEDFERLVEQARSEANNPSFKLRLYWPQAPPLIPSGRLNGGEVPLPRPKVGGRWRRTALLSLADGGRIGCWSWQETDAVGRGKGRMLLKEGLRWSAATTCRTCLVPGSPRVNKGRCVEFTPRRGKEPASTSLGRQLAGQGEMGATSTAPGRPRPAKRTVNARRENRLYGVVGRRSKGGDFYHLTRTGGQLGTDRLEPGGSNMEARGSSHHQHIR
ncbi:Uncharacterized protein TCAP_06929 [Tolypocladium capitatum]|uniref:Methyltransferase type 11 domain-containing protein n=1 Tax=Tolypocladium capitatum TaxID=45235 RepID=A0A2K3Q6I3_9HYPO|nr:Uncharacterized protein TCAP_06929 [Tolypocladium capitatum]